MGGLSSPVRALVGSRAELGRGDPRALPCRPSAAGWMVAGLAWQGVCRTSRWSVARLSRCTGRAAKRPVFPSLIHPILAEPWFTDWGISSKGGKPGIDAGSGFIVEVAKCDHEKK